MGVGGFVEEKEQRNGGKQSPNLLCCPWLGMLGLLLSVLGS